MSQQPPSDGSSQLSSLHLFSPNLQSSRSSTPLSSMQMLRSPDPQTPLIFSSPMSPRSHYESRGTPMARSRRSSSVSHSTSPHSTSPLQVPSPSTSTPPIGPVFAPCPRPQGAVIPPLPMFSQKTSHPSSSRPYGYSEVNPSQPYQQYPAYPQYQYPQVNEGSHAVGPYIPTVYPQKHVQVTTMHRRRRSETPSEAFYVEQNGTSYAGYSRVKSEKQGVYSSSGGYGPPRLVTKRNVVVTYITDEPLNTSPYQPAIGIGHPPHQNHTASSSNR